VVDNETAWKCEGCGLEFELEVEALEHEKKCFQVNVSIDEAITYGFNMFKGISKYIILFILLIIVGFYTLAGEFGSKLAIFGILFFIAGSIIIFILFISLKYKIWVDILARSRK